MKMTISKLTVLAALSTLVMGCASIAGNNDRTVTVHSNPEGAKVFVGHKQYGTTPAVVRLPTYIYGGKEITVKKAGYESQTQTVNSKFQPVGLLNILFWPGFIIDAATGSTVKIDPAQQDIHYDLKKS